MLVLISGMMRSGSTFTFNVAKHLLTRQGESLFWEPIEHIEELLKSQGSVYDHILFKQHHGDEFSRLLIKQQCARTICSFRDPLEALASWMQVFGHPFDESLQHFKRSIEFIAFQRDHALMISYDEIENKPTKVIKKIARHLNLPVGFGEPKSIALNLKKEKVKTRYDGLQKEEADIQDMGFTFYDKNTFFHRRHVRGDDAIAAADFFSEEEQALIRKELAPAAN